MLSLKNYNKANDDIHLSDEMKDKLVRNMTQTAKHPMKRYVMVVMTCLILIVSIVVYHQIEVRQEATKDHEKADFVSLKLSDYIQEYGSSQSELTLNKLAGTKASMDIAGERGVLDVLEFGIEAMADSSLLNVPKGFTCTENFMTWSYEDQGPYPLLNFEFQKEAYYIIASIEDERIPECVEFYQEVDAKDYKGYDLTIYRNDNGTLHYNAYATKDGYRYKVNAMVENDTIFEEFLISFLR